MYDIITIGDTTVDVFLDVDEKTKLCKMDKDKEWLNIRYASKVPIRHVNQVAGTGNAANVAHGTSRLGLRTAIYTVLGGDDKGQEIQTKFVSSNIDTKYIKVEKDTDTNMSVIIDYKGDRTALVHHEDREYKLPRFSKPKWIYFSSVCGNHKDINKEINNYVKQKKVKLAFNPGSLQMRLGAKGLRPILSVAEVVFLNREEAEKLTTKNRNIRKLLQAVKKLGPKVVVITDGREGSYCYNGKNMYHVGIIDLPVVERTGCGDAYASGFTSALFYDLDIREAMRWGSANGAHAAMEIGSQDGLLHKKQLENMLRRHSHLQPKNI